MSDQQIHTFLEALDWGDAYKWALMAAKRRLRFFRLNHDRMLNAQQYEDVVQRVFVKIIEKPSLLRPEDLTVSGFERRIGNMINSEIYGLMVNSNTQRTRSFDPTSPMLDEEFFDQMMTTILSGEEAEKLRREGTEILDRLSAELEQAGDETSMITWVVLNETRDGKKSRQISADNGIPISAVYNANRRIDTALKNAYLAGVR
jgi:hypothetical protein